MLILTGTVLVTALATSFDLMFRLFYLLVFVLIGSYVWSWFSLRGLEVTVDRDAPRAEVGGRIEERIMVQSHSPLPKSLLEIEDQTDLPGHMTGRAISLPSHGYDSWKASTLCRRRGIYTVGPLVARGSDPFGLFKRKRAYAGQQTVVVYPRTLDLRKFGIPAAELSGEASLRQRVAYSTPHASTIRDYSYSDPVGRIHWPSTARLGKLMVKEFDHGRSSNIWIYLDLDQFVQAGENEESTDEYAVTIAASIAKKYLEAGQPVGLISYGDRKYLLPAETGRSQMERIMEFLAMSKPEGEIPLQEALPKEEGLFTRYGSLIVITPSWHSDWIPALKILAKRQVRVAAVLLDLSTFGGRQSNAHILPDLAVNGIPAFMVKRGDDIPTVLSKPYRLDETPPMVQAVAAGELL